MPNKIGVMSERDSLVNHTWEQKGHDHGKGSYLGICNSLRKGAHSLGSLGTLVSGPPLAGLPYVHPSGTQP